MSSDAGREAEWLGDIIENSDRVAAYLGDMTFEQFRRETMVRDAVERCLQRITEAAIRIGRERWERIAPDLALHEVRGLGNLLRHRYEHVNPLTIWETATYDLPALRAACAVALGQG